MCRSRPTYLPYQDPFSRNQDFLNVKGNCDKALIHLHCNNEVDTTKLSATKDNKRTNERFPIKLSATLKHLAAKFFHCENSNQSCLQSSTAATSVSTTSTSHRSKSQTICLQAFFKIVFLFFVISSVTVSASPLRKSVITSSPRSRKHSTSFNSHLRKDENSMHLLHTTHGMELTIQRQKILTRVFARSRRSINQCTYIENLYKLWGFAYNETTKALNRRKRDVSRPNDHRSWGDRYHRIHETLKKGFCEIEARPNLFQDSTHSIKNTIDSMIVSLQQEMNLLKPPMSFTSKNAEDCLTQYPGERDNSVAKRIKQDLHRLQLEFSAICSHIQNN